MTCNEALNLFERTGDIALDTTAAERAAFTKHFNECFWCNIKYTWIYNRLRDDEGETQIRHMVRKDLADPEVREVLS